MPNSLAIVAISSSLLLFADADVPRAMGLRSPDASAKPNFSNAEVAIFPALASDDPQQQAAAPSQARKDKLQ